MELKKIVEALIFASEKPISAKELEAVLEDCQEADIKKAISELELDYRTTGRALKTREVAGGYQIVTDPELHQFVAKLYKSRRREKLKGASLETLAIVAYKQPVSRADVEIIRGVSSEGVVSNLLDKALIKIIGRKDTPGRPFVYGTTKEFLIHFGLNSLKELPRLEDFAIKQDEAFRRMEEEGKLIIPAEGEENEEPQNITGEDQPAGPEDSLALEPTSPENSGNSPDQEEKVS